MPTQPKNTAMGKYGNFNVKLTDYTECPPPRYQDTFKHHGRLLWDWDSYIANFDFYSKDTMYSNLYQLTKLDDPRKWDSVIHDINTLNDDLFKHCQNWMKTYFGMSRIDVALFKCNPGSISTLHKDNFYGCRIRRGWEHKVPADRVFETMTKYWIPLQDRKPGHFFECDGVVLSDWKQGDMWTFANERGHLGATVAEDPRYYLAIAGITDIIWDTL